MAEVVQKEFFRCKKQKNESAPKSARNMVFTIFVNEAWDLSQLNSCADTISNSQTKCQVEIRFFAKLKLKKVKIG